MVGEHGSRAGRLRIEMTSGKMTGSLEPPSPRLDLAVIIPILAKYGGAERYLIECVQFWQDRHDITIYSTTINRSLLEEHGVKDCVRRVEITSYFDGEHSMLLNALLLPKIWRNEIGRHDLYHTHLWPTHLIDLHPMVWFPHEPLRLSHDLRFEQNVAVVGKSLARNLHVYPKFNYDRLDESYFEASLSSIDVMDKAAWPERIVGNSHHTARYLEGVYGRPVKDVVYPGVRGESFIELPVDPKLFVTIGQLWGHKRVGLLIEAIALSDDTQLIVIGSGAERQHLEDLADRLGVADRVFFLSELSNHEVRLVLARANAFLYAAVNEPFGIVVLEAMAAGKPVIAVNQGGYVEVCSSDFAFLLPPFPSAFAEKISYLRSNPDVARRMGHVAKGVAEQYTWKRTADELEALLLDTWRASRVHAGEAAQVRVEGPLVGIQYYAWYGDGFGAEHWNDSRKSGYVSDKPLLGYYSSSKGQTIEFHLELFDQMGLDFVIINLHVDAEGVNGLELISARHLLEIAQRRGSKLRFAIQIAPYTSDAMDLEKAIPIVKKVFVTQPNYLHLNDMPALFWFWSSAWDGDKRLLDRLAVATEGLANIALSLRLPHGSDEGRQTFGFFRGFAPFSPLELAEEANWTRVWNDAYRDAEKAGMEQRIVTISPGYDDRNLDDEQRSGNPYRRVPREEGRTYRRSMDFVEGLPKTPDLVVISTFNEYHENSHIEPSLRNGMRYVDMTREFVARIKSKWSGRAG
jgi:glycosyltransferase involved in cell wall biosynthesis